MKSHFLGELPTVQFSRIMALMPSEPMHNPKAELQPEYRFDYQKAKPNRFVHQTRGQAARGDGTPHGRTGLEEDQ